MSFEGLLNLLWALIGASAFGLLVYAELRPHRSRPGRLNRAFAVFLAIVFLFPCVSASDDLVTLNHLQFTVETVGEAGKSQSHGTGLHLARFFENLQSVPIQALFSLTLILCYFAMVVCRTRTSQGRHVASFCGRAPPAARAFA